MTELGSIEKPPVGNFTEKRKLYCVPNVYPFPDAPQEFAGMLARYWEEVAVQLAKLEAAGKVRKIFVEHTNSGDAGAEEMLRRNEGASTLVAGKQEQGAQLVPFEDPEVMGDYFDWSNCLRVVMTRPVFEKILGFFTDASTRRLEQLAGVIDKNLLAGEAGLLVMNEGDRSKLPLSRDIEVFLVTPPSYDNILRWMRDRNSSQGAVHAAE